MVAKVRKATARVLEDLLKLVARSRQQSHEFLETYGVTVPQSGVLRVLRREGSQPIGTLAETLYLKTSTVSGIIDRLERDKHVDRVRGNTDRRVVLVELTPTGRKLAENLPVTSYDKVRRAIEQLEGDEVNSLMNLMSRLLKLIEAEEASERG